MIGNKTWNIYLKNSPFSGCYFFLFSLPSTLMQGMPVNQLEFSCVSGMKNTEKHWHVYINIQKYVLPVYLGTTCVRKRVALLRALHSCRNRCLGLWDRRQLLSPLHFLLWLLQDSISIFSAVWTLSLVRPQKAQS